MNIEKALYQTSVTSTGGRDGNVRSADGILDLKVGMPKELGGAGNPVTNPEQLFAAGYSACFLSALKLVASLQKINLSPETSITAKVTLGKTAADEFCLAVTLTASLPGVDKTAAEALVHQAHNVCPYSRATRGNIEVDVKVA